MHDSNFPGEQKYGPQVTTPEADDAKKPDAEKRQSADESMTEESANNKNSYYNVFKTQQSNQEEKYMQEEPHVIQSQRFQMVDWTGDISLPDEAVTQDLLAGIEKMELLVR